MSRPSRRAEERGQNGERRRRRVGRKGGKSKVPCKGVGEKCIICLSGRISIGINSTTTMWCLCVSCCPPLSLCPLTLVEEREAAGLTATHSPPSAPALRPTQIPRQPTSHHQSGKYTNTYSLHLCAQRTSLAPFAQFPSSS